ncbi:MAG TPA: GNAT family N-acetyltransferase [Pirellulales bacterium]|jgi:predicted N-acetyltransferase YhbS|nr:GNAT family N-acetyltransferase [Pirellulales bacterium]
MSAGFSASREVRRVDGANRKSHPRNIAAPPHFVPPGPSSAPHSSGALPPAAPQSLYFPCAVPGRSGDHLEIFQLLLAVFQGPTSAEFHAAQDDPLYEPTDRLVVKRGERILSHVHLTKRSLRFGGERVPVAGLNWLGTLPEFRGQGCAASLLRAAETQMREDGAVLGQLRTKIPHFFRRFGWAVCGRHSFSRAKPREVLANLSDGGYLHRSSLNIRFWRHVELPALMRIYRQNTDVAHGPLDRSENYWRWLVSRKAFDQIIVAIDGPDKLELEETSAPIVGYAVVRGRQVVELLTTPGHPTAGPLLLARACGDLIEHDDRPVTLQAPIDDPLHRFMQGCGGLTHHHESDQGEVLMVKLLDESKWIRAIAPALLARARAADLTRPCELGLLSGGARWQVVVSSRGVKFLRGKLGRSYLALNPCELARLFLGHLDLPEAAAQNRVEPSTQTALETAAALFPRLPLWRPLWDDLPA